MAAAVESGVGRMVFPNVDESSIGPMMALHRRFPDNTFVAMGLHPTEVHGNWREIVDRMEAMLRAGGFVAVGEVGIDLYWDKTEIDNQKAAFCRQLEIAEQLRLPVIIHMRDALEETLECISKVKPTVNLVFHSFTGTKEDVARIREVCDPYFGVNGVATFKKSETLREALPEIRVERILLETDAPYLTPHPHRGKRNEPKMVLLTLDVAAQALGLSPEELEAATDRNAEKVFKLQKALSPALRPSPPAP